MGAVRWMALVLAAIPGAFAQEYKILRIVKSGGGTSGSVYADSAGRRLYVPRGGAHALVSVLDLDTLNPVAEIPGVDARGIAISSRCYHGFATSKPVAMWDSKTYKILETIDAGAAPGAILSDPYQDRVYVFSRSASNATVINAADGTIAGTVDLGGVPGEPVSDGNGRVYVVMEDRDFIAGIDTRSLTVSSNYDISGRGGSCTGLAMDVKDGILFATCRNPQNLVIVAAANGKVIGKVPIGPGAAGAGFNPDTQEIFISHDDGTLTIVKQTTPSDYAVTQTLPTMHGARSLTLDGKTGHLFLIGGSPLTILEVGR